ncbi:MAG: DnaJ C-terminal domain-containing protein [Phycisphaerales bacterium]
MRGERCPPWAAGASPILAPPKAHMDRDLYEILGVSRTASADDLKKAHRTLVRKFHPDVNKEPGAAARFKEIQEAYDVLADDDKRKRYDQFGMAGVRAGPAGGPSGGGAPGADPFGGANPFGGGGQGWQNVDPSTFEDVFGSVFGGGRARGGRGRGFGGFGGFEEADAGPQKGRDLTMEETVDFTTAALGGKRSITVNGQGIQLSIPAGTLDGARLAVRGKGAPGASGGTAGDLIVTVRVAPHPWLRREGDDLVMDVPLTIAEAALGTTVKVPLLSGSVQMRIPPGVKSGQRLRVKGKGIQPAKGQAGDFHAVIAIEAPKDLDARGRELVEELAPRLPSPRTGAQWRE